MRRFDILTSLLATSADRSFHSWCNSVGIETPLASLRTTPESVAGRGVFAVDDIKQGDVTIRIPEEIVMHDLNARKSFPSVGKTIDDKRRRFQRQSKWWRKLFPQKINVDSEWSDESDWWQAELTLFSLACLEDDDHPWYPWISQWQRSDPMQDLFENGVSWKDENAIACCVSELQKLLPEVPEYKIRAAIELRLRRVDDLQAIFDLDKSALPMYGVLMSRALELGDGVVGVLPMFDMVNHSNDPNLALSFDGEYFELWARRDIKKDEELFLCYNKDKSEKWDEDCAIWTLVQWGIPDKSKNTNKLSSTEQRLELNPR